MPTDERTGTLLTRRRFLALAGVVGFASAVHVSNGCTPSGSQRHVVLGTRTRVVDGQDHSTWLAVLDRARGTVVQVPIPIRGHSVVQHPTQPDLVVVLAQRAQFRPGSDMPQPGVDSCEVSLSGQRVTRVFRADEGHHFYGHGAYTTDGSVLLTTENDFGHDGRGVLTARDAQTLRSIGRIPTYGVDPHELRLIQGGNIAVVANGGERTHPDYPLIVLNPDARDSNVTWIDMNSGRLVDQATLPTSRYSLRHMDVTEDGTVALALQDGVADVDGDHMPLAVRYRGGELRLLSGPSGLAERVRYHALSVSLTPDGSRAIATHPKGNCVTVWDLATGEMVSALDIAAPTGVAFDPIENNFLVSSATGSLFMANLDTPESVEEIPDPEPDVEWDSHLLRTVIPSGRSAFSRRSA